MVAPAMHSSTTHTWQTPACVLERVRRIDDIACDPCTTEANPAGATRWIAPPRDGLVEPWGEGLAFVNPPYGRVIGAWVDRCAAAAAEGSEVVLLLPARTDTAWWARAWSTAGAVCFWRGRMIFVGASAGAPFPSALLYFGPRWRRFERAFGDAGIVVMT